MTFDRGEWETRTAERNAADWPEDRPARPTHDWTELDQAQEFLMAARADYEDALTGRAHVVTELQKGGATIYAIAKRLGVTQSAVRKMLGL